IYLRSRIGGWRRPAAAGSATQLNISVAPAPRSLLFFGFLGPLVEDFAGRIDFDLVRLALRGRDVDLVDGLLVLGLRRNLVDLVLPRFLHQRVARGLRDLVERRFLLVLLGLVAFVLRVGGQNRSDAEGKGDRREQHCTKTHSSLPCFSFGLVRTTGAAPP